jgi:hypothetical protein
MPWPGSRFSPGSALGRPIMGVRGEALQRVNRPFPRRDNGQQSARSRFNRPGQDSVSANAELVRWTEIRPWPSPCPIGPDASQDHGDLAGYAFFEPMRRASRVPHALRGDQRCTLVRRTLAAT